MSTSQNTMLQWYLVPTKRWWLKVPPPFHTWEVKKSPVVSGIDKTNTFFF